MTLQHLKSGLLLLKRLLMLPLRRGPLEVMRLSHLLHRAAQLLLACSRGMVLCVAITVCMHAERDRGGTCNCASACDWKHESTPSRTRALTNVTTRGQVPNERKVRCKVQVCAAS